MEGRGKIKCTGSQLVCPRKTKCVVCRLGYENETRIREARKSYQEQKYHFTKFTQKK